MQHCNSINKSKQVSNPNLSKVTAIITAPTLTLHSIPSWHHHGGYFIIHFLRKANLNFFFLQRKSSSLSMQLVPCTPVSTFVTFKIWTHLQSIISCYKARHYHQLSRMNRMPLFIFSQFTNACLLRECKQHINDFIWWVQRVTSS